MDAERILHLLAKRLGKDASEEEIKELNNLISNHSEFHYFVDILQSIEGEKRHYEPVAQEQEVIDESWSKLETILPGRPDDCPFERTRETKSGYIWMLRAAVWAGLVLCGATVFYLWRPLKKTRPEMVTKTRSMTVPYGAPEKKILPDSSIVWLNAGSYISYADHFIGTNREVYLDGEACFDVKYDAKHPFVVHAGNIVINVLGTKFNIKAYDDENRIETTLINGKLQVQIADNPDKKIVLAPHEKLTVINQRFDIEGRELTKQKELSFQVKGVTALKGDSTVSEIAWLQDKLAFQNERFGELARGLERRYNVHLIFKDTLLMKERLNGVLENESIGKAMQLLQMTTPFHYKITGDTVYLKQ